VSESWITLNVNQTISVLTIKTMHELIQFINQHRQNREIGHYFGTTLMTHSFLHPEIFGKDFFKNDFDKIIDIMPTNTWQQIQAKKHMNGIYMQINSKTRNQIAINQLGIFLDEIDRRRNLNWQKTFPWLQKEIKNVV
jgi:hypothetical protein